jgi:hypothetical protein
LLFKESAFHTDLGLVGSSGAWGYAVFGGASFFSVQSDVIERLTYSQSYPYDTVTGVQPSSQQLKDSPVGFNVGGRLDYRFGQSRRFALGVQLRYSNAKAKLSDTLQVDVGGLQAGGGVRLYF